MKKTMAGALGALALLAAVPAAVPATAAEAMTTITMKVTGCEGCTITPVQAIEGSSSFYGGTPAKVTGGVATFVVPTSKTVGMSFNLQATWRVNTNAMPVIATQYKGYAAGTTVTPAQARAGKQATACWAGTTLPTVAVQVMVVPIFVPGFPSGRAKVPMAWFVPTAATTGGFSPTFHGTIAQQDAWYCP